MVTIVQDRPDEERYEIRVDGQLAGFAAYRLSRDVISVLHTEIDPAFQGQGLAGQLVRDMLADIASRELGLYPFCPLVHRVIRKDLAAYLQLVPENARERFRLPATADEPASEDGPPPLTD